MPGAYSRLQTSRLMVTTIALMSATLCAQAGGIAGNWQGTLEVGPLKLRLGIHIARNGQGELVSTVDSLDQNVLGIPSRQTTFQGGRLHIDIPNLRAQYDGTLSADGSEIAGTFSQGGIPGSLLLKHAELIAARALRVYAARRGWTVDMQVREVRSATGLAVCVHTITAPEMFATRIDSISLL